MDSPPVPEQSTAGTGKSPGGLIPLRRCCCRVADAARKRKPRFARTYLTTYHPSQQETDGLRHLATPLGPSEAEETTGSADGDALLPFRLSQLLGDGRRFERRPLGAFFSFVTGALSPPVVGDGRQNGKVGKSCIRPPGLLRYHCIGLDFQIVLFGLIVYHILPFIQTVVGCLCITHFFLDDICECIKK